MYEGKSMGASVMAATIRITICGTNKPKDNTNVLIFNHSMEGVFDDKGGTPIPPTNPSTPVDEKMILGVGAGVLPEFACKEIDLER